MSFSNPSVPGSGQNMTLSRNENGTLATLVMPYRYSAPDLSYIIERSTTLSGWTSIANVDSGANLIYPKAGVQLTNHSAVSITLTDSFIPGQPKVFYRVNATVKAP